MLFDCWGTLVQAPNLMRRGASTEFFHRFLTEDGHDIDYDAFKDAYIAQARMQREETLADHREFDYPQRIESTLRAIGFEHPQRRQLAQAAWSNYLSEWPRQSTPYDETPALLSSIKGRYRLGLVTNFPDGYTARKAFEKLGFDAMFDSLVISDEVGYRKPSPIIFERALMELGSAPDSTVMVGDTYEADIVGAKNMGMKAIFVDADGSQAEEHDLADAVVRSIGEIAEILARF